ncbi:YraN family protein [Egibacter rhizosphaerae]|uniref:UPF0102 protein ER308_05015 n=1 Tax=Egibacter rhizosphaerae TaxID=1670831 RepID=A0A411YCM3_9ACTN|nr:YraN family protein [Egibacter rhizosphaerae]QBI18964.1 YraN family protein [Egibacter rhizosphaerae]
MTQRRARLGRIGERMATRHLQDAGLEVLDRNWRCPDDEVRGEIDLVARDGETLVVCEVKTRRRGDDGEPLVAVDARKARRLRRLAAAWLAQDDRSWPGVRIDAIAVSWPASGGSARVVHVRGVA